MPDPLKSGAKTSEFYAAVLGPMFPTVLEQVTRGAVKIPEEAMPWYFATVMVFISWRGAIKVMEILARTKGGTNGSG